MKTMRKGSGKATLSYSEATVARMRKGSGSVHARLEAGSNGYLCLYVGNELVGLAGGIVDAAALAASAGKPLVCAEPKYKRPSEVSTELASVLARM
jgi:hypothetical protein